MKMLATLGPKKFHRINVLFEKLSMKDHKPEFQVYKETNNND